MWDSMQRAGYFRFHPLYGDWTTDQKIPPPVTPATKADPLESLVLPDIIKNIDFNSNEIVLELPGEPMATFNHEVVPILMATEEVWFQAFVKLNPAMVALDIGCGYGRTEQWMHTRVRTIHGVDISKHIIKICRQRFSRIKNVRFHHNDGDNLSMFRPNMFDLVYSFTVFQHIPRSYFIQYLREMERVLKPGGFSLFNLLSGVNYDVQEGHYGTEWVIGYRRDDAKQLIKNVGLRVLRIAEWKISGLEPFWCWFVVSKG